MPLTNGKIIVSFKNLNANEEIASENNANKQIWQNKNSNMRTNVRGLPKSKERREKVADWNEDAVTKAYHRWDIRQKEDAENRNHRVESITASIAPN